MVLLTLMPSSSIKDKSAKVEYKKLHCNLANPCVANVGSKRKILLFPLIVHVLLLQC